MRPWLLGLAVISVLFVTGVIYFARMSKSPHSRPFTPLSESEELLRGRLEEHVSTLAGEIGQRNLLNYKGLEASATYIEKVLVGLGYEVGRQEFKVNRIPVTNLEAELRGTSLPAEIVVVGAHYDSVTGSPGANDNASGVAAVLEIARFLSRSEVSRTVRFVAFVNEEPPFFMTEDMGSRVYASRSRRRGEQIVAMLSIETIGYYSDARWSQRYPFLPLRFFYPSTANFIGFVGNISSRKLVNRAVATFREHTDFPVESIAAPEILTGVDWSDHWSFWKEGYPAIMITDTALFRYEHYHAPEDTPDKLVYPHMARVVAGITRVVAELAGNKTPESNPQS